MKLQSVKNDSQLALAGVKFDVQWVDNSIAQVTATDADGGMIVFKKESYDMRVLVKAPPKMVKRFLLSGSVAGVPIESFYDDRYEAQGALDKHQRMVSSDEYCSLEISEVEVAEAE